MTDPRNAADFRPGWAAGVELRQTTIDCIQVVGDVRRPVSLRGIDGRALEWLRQLDGERSWQAQLTEAQARGVPLSDARELLEQLRAAELLVDFEEGGPHGHFEDTVVVGAPALVDAVKHLLPTARDLGRLPKPRDGDDWRLRSEQLFDDVRDWPVIVALDAPWVDAAEFDFVARLIEWRTDHVVVGAGSTTARIGPLTLAGSGPCLRCDELLRIDLDPSWKQLSAQLALDGAAEPGPNLVALAAAELVRQITNAAPRSEVAALNAVLKTGYRGGAWKRRPLARHARCSCWWPDLGVRG